MFEIIAQLESGNLSDIERQILTKELEEMTKIDDECIEERLNPAVEFAFYGCDQFPPIPF